MVSKGLKVSGSRVVIFAAWPTLGIMPMKSKERVGEVCFLLRVSKES